MKMVPLGELIRSAAVERAGAETYPILSMTMHHGLVDQTAKFKKAVASQNLSQYKVVRRGQLVVSFPIDEGVLGFQEIYAAAIVSPAYAVWDLVDDSRVDRSYLGKYLKSPKAIQYYRAKLRGSTARRRSLPKSVFLAHEVPLPPLDEQRRIAAILDKADAIRQKRRQAIAHLDTLSQSVFHEMFKDSMSSAHSTTVGELASLIGGKSLPSIDEATPTNNRVLKISAVTTGTFQPLESKAVPDSYKPPESHFVQPNDLLISRANTAELVGASAIATGEVSGLLLPDKIWRFIWKKDIDPIYFHHLLRSPTVRSRISKLATGSGGSMKNISKTKLLSLSIPDVAVAEQSEFASRIRAISHIRTIFQSQPAESLFRSLQSRAFRGEL